MNAPAWMKEAGSAYCRIFGMPDYEAYLAHMARRHPDRPVLPRDEFARQWIDMRYMRSAGRCC